MRKSLNLAALVGALILVMTITGCSSTPEAEPMSTSTAQPTPTAEAAPAPTETPVPAAPVGSRENPVPVGQVLAFREGSAFKVGAAAPTENHGSYAVLPITIDIDWASIKSQFPNEQSPAFTPWGNLRIQFVSASGQSYDTMDDYSIDQSTDLYAVGDVYEGTNNVRANVFVSVPGDQISGGTWVIENSSSGDKVFVAVE